MPGMGQAVDLCESDRKPSGSTKCWEILDKIIISFSNRAIFYIFTRLFLPFLSFSIPIHVQQVNDAPTCRMPLSLYIFIGVYCRNIATSANHSQLA
jgi:hypothetical protein